MSWGVPDSFTVNPGDWGGAPYGNPVESTTASSTSFFSDPNVDPTTGNYGGWSNAQSTVPSQVNPYAGGLPNFFRDLPSQFGNISPVGMAALINMFGNANFQNAPLKTYTQTPEVKAKGATDTAPAVEGTPAVEKQTSWVMPDLPSAQTFKQMQAGGAQSPFEAYLDLQGEAIKQQFMNQARAAWAPSEQRRPAEWRIPKM